jgi:predicted ferric reductase
MIKATIVLLSASLLGLLLGAGFTAQWFDHAFPDPGAHGPWYASRAAGLAAYLALWASLQVGLLMSSAWFDGLVNRGRLVAAHQTLAVAGVAFALLHALVLIPDQWTSFGLLDLFVPFAADFRPALSGLGTISFFLFAMVTFSFWFRSTIGTRSWRLIHYASLVAYAAALWHGLRLGTDTAEIWAASLYVATLSLFLAAVALRLTHRRPIRRPRANVMQNA